MGILDGPGSLVFPRDNSNLLTVGEETFPRGNAANNLQLITGRVYLTYWTARKTETITQIRTITATTAAAATPTLCRAGIYSIASNGDGTLVASFANDTTLWAAAQTAYTKNLTSSWAKVAGRRYAFALIVVTGGTAPSFPGSGVDFSTGMRAEQALAPRLTGALLTQTDLPASFLAADPATMAAPIYGSVFP